MTKALKFLVLTDHSGHSEHNSIYPLIRELVKHPQIHSVDIASRGVFENDKFFKNKKLDGLHVVAVDTDFQYQESGEQFSQALKKVDYKSYDAVWLRLPRPVEDDFLLWLEDEVDGVIFNRPRGILETSNKSFLLEIQKVCPPIKKVHTVEEVLSFALQMDIVLKPLKEYGGRGLIKISDGMVDDGKEIHNAKAYLVQLEPALRRDGYLAMKFLKNVSKGDKRILVVNGELLAASLRLPAEGSWLCNVAQGGTSVATEVTNEEREIIEFISPILTEKGIVMFGADTLTDDDGKRVLSEVNTLSIGGFPHAEAQTGKPIISITIQKIIDYVRTRIDE
jgi:glutathione synthase